jgi:hypothetical protein
MVASVANYRWIPWLGIARLARAVVAIPSRTTATHDSSQQSDSDILAYPNELNPPLEHRKNTEDERVSAAPGAEYGKGS